MAEVNLKPQLRFPEFEGEWEEKRLGKIGEYIGGGTPDTFIEEYWQGDIPWVSSSDIHEDSIHKIEKTRFITKKAIAESATKLIPKGSILIISRVGIGKFAIADEELCTSQDFTSLITDENEYFLGYYFKNKANRFISLSQGTSIKGFSTKDIKSTKFNIPPLAEQTKIANFLTAVDKRINLLQKKKAELEQYKKGIMQKLFSQTIRFKDENGNDFPDWEEKKLGEVCEKKSSNISANSLNESGGLYKIYGATGYLQNVSFYKEKEPYISIVKDGAGVGRTLLCDGKTSVLGTLDVLRPKDNNNLYFLFFLVNKIHFTKYITGSTIPHIYYRDYSNEKLFIPQLSEQTKIANFLSSIGKSIEKLGNQIETTTKFKQGLLQKMFV